MSKSRSFVVGTAGHIDHGKTSLVRALTGLDTDRLPEEKRRGITIALGFAPWQVAKDLQASIVDMPGHESFVRTMVAGAMGIDIVIFVISAEDGVMPQTREHLNICRLLGITRGVVMLTKIDLLGDDPDALALAIDDVRESLADTPFAEAQIIPTSSVTGAGLDELRRTVAKLIRELPRRDSKGSIILPIDRVFTIKGHGTVVTGTLMSGSVAVEKSLSLQLVPTGEQREIRELRARAAQVRGESVDRVVAGSRVALNLANVQVAEVSRGDVIADGPEVVRTDTFHAWVSALPHSPSSWKSPTTMQLCAGTANVVVRIDPLVCDQRPDDTDGVSIGPGEDGLVRIRCDAPIAIWRGQHVVLRSFSSSEDVAKHHGLTVGGGEIVDPEPGVGRGQRQRWITLGRTLHSGDVAEQAHALIADAGAMAIARAELRRRLGLVDIEPALTSLIDRQAIVELTGDRLVDRSVLDRLEAAAVTLVDRFHGDNPMQPGMSRAAIESSLPGRIDPAVASLATTRTIERGQLRIADAGGNVARPGKGVLDREALPPQMLAVAKLYEARGLQPPTLKEVQAECSLSPRETLDIVTALQRTKILVRVSDDLSFHESTHTKLVEDTKARLASHGETDVQVMKEQTGLSRKFVMPLLEHLDQIGITRRAGDRRVPGPKSGVG